MAKKETKAPAKAPAKAAKKATTSTTETQASTQPTTQDEILNIDGVPYKVSELTDNAKAQVVNLRVVDQKINSLKQELAIMQTARATFSGVLRAELPKKQ